jgi:hypothetical protein
VTFIDWINKNKGRLKAEFQTAFLKSQLGLLSIYPVLHYNCANLTHSKENKLEGLQQLVDLLVGFVDWILKLLAFLF